MLPSKEELKSRVCATIDAQSERINIAKHILSNPEIGFKKSKTADPTDKCSDCWSQKRRMVKP